MNSFEEDSHFWKGKWVLAREGVGEAAQQLKAKLSTNAYAKDHPLLTCSMSLLLQDSKFHALEGDETIGGYQVYSKVPTFLLLEGRTALQCISHEGDTEMIKGVDGCGVLEVGEEEIKAKFGESNVNIATGFEVVAKERACLVELSAKAMLQALTGPDKKEVDLRQEAIMRKHMLIVLKHLERGKKVKGRQVEEKLYLLHGRACYYDDSTKLMLACYQEGYFNPKHLADSEIKFHLFEGAQYVILQEDMLKDQVGSGVEAKRQQHLRMVQQRYKGMPVQGRKRYQEKLIVKYRLNRREVDRQICGVVEKAAVSRQSKPKRQLSVTNTSLKEKCGIRIRKTKKVI